MHELVVIYGFGDRRESLVVVEQGRARAILDAVGHPVVPSKIFIIRRG